MTTATATAEILLYGSIGPGSPDEPGVTAREFVRQLDYLSDEDEVNVRINSGGGSVTDGLAMHAAIIRARGRGQRITTWNDGAAFSMAAILLQSGTARIVADNSLTMLHDPYTPSGGNASELRKLADVLDKTALELVDIVATRARQPKATVQGWFAKESWFDAKEAVAFGLADKRYTDTSHNPHASLAATNSIFAKYKIPARYEIAARAPIEAAIADVETDARIAVRANAWSTYTTFRGNALRASAKLLQQPGVTNHDVRRLHEAIERINAAENCRRD